MASGLADLQATIIAMCRADPVLGAAEAAGPSLLSADETKRLPYLVVSVQRGPRLQRYFGGSAIERFRYDLTAVAGSATEVAALIDAAHTLFESVAFATASGTVVQSLVAGSPAFRTLKHLGSGQPMYEAAVGFVADYVA